MTSPWHHNDQFGVVPGSHHVDQDADHIGGYLESFADYAW
jgi:hypothetical protein